MTYEEKHDIINALPNNQRKKACQVVLELNIGDDRFWLNVLTDEWGKAAECLVTTQDAFKYMLTVAMLADMIWEG